MKHSFLFALTALFVTACGGGYNPDKDALQQAQKIGDQAYFEISPGVGLMADTVSSVSSGANFEVSFTLEEGGRFRVSTFADSQLKNGIDFVFTRQGTKLFVFSSAQGQTQEWSSLFNSVDATGVLTFTIDVHNNEHPSHILLWKGSKNASMDHRNTLYNSAEDSLDLNYDNSPGNGFGRNWGFKLEKAQLLKAVLSAPQESH
ncbi:hypothetical protein AZI87_04245 [Bdellovibrio bacteriovorus]|uniref:Lipoprotein n=1 Tax=Bdellovibrio bacteriovorus TaxID=959 RepID=A0A162GLX1_BDEBC|nr:hypothetical protein [Bdellovibrio bacteriovorus]KYG68465.1 hypothetical protein AZI87_04245 [Bdellovibrio bacteriovorus]